MPGNWGSAQREVFLLESEIFQMLDRGDSI